MEPWQSDDLPFAVSDNQDSSENDKSDKLQVRRDRNREDSRCFRQRRKAKVQMLERREAELTEEVAQLRELSVQAPPDYYEKELRDCGERFRQKLAVCLSNPEVTDLELNAMIDELEEHAGVYSKPRIGKMANTFQNTLSLVLPMHVKFSIWISGSEASGDHFEFPKWEDFLKSTSLTLEQTAAFEEYQRSFEQDKGGLKESFGQFKQTSLEIVAHARVLHSLLQEVRQMMKPRQVAALVVWMAKYYSFLAADRVLNYGDNSSDFLRSA